MLDYLDIGLGQQIFIGTIGTVRIDNDKFISKGDGLDALFDITDFVVGNNKRGNMWFWGFQNPYFLVIVA